MRESTPEASAPRAIGRVGARPHREPDRQHSGMTALPEPAAEVVVAHVRCIARAEGRCWCPEHQFPSPPDHCVACQRPWPCDVERLARAVEDAG